MGQAEGLALGAGCALLDNAPFAGGAPLERVGHAEPRSFVCAGGAGGLGIDLAMD